MFIPFNGGEVVCNRGHLNYQAVLDDFDNAKQIRILTYNISKKSYSNILIDALKKVPKTVDVQIITNIPSHYTNYYNSHSQSAYQQNFMTYLDKLNPENFESNPYVGFNFTNHAKIIGTDNIVYIGSANYSDESKNNIESGTLIRDKSFIKNLYDEIFTTIMDESTPYFDDDFNVLRLFIISMENKFSAWLYKFDEDLIRENTNTKARMISDFIAFDEDDLYELVADLDELNGLKILIENTYTEDDDEYNDVIEKIEKQFDGISLDWMSNFVSIDSEFYDVIVYNEEEKAIEYLQEYPDAYDENLDNCVEESMNTASEEYYDMKSKIEEDIIFFRDEINKIVILLSDAYKKIMPFSKAWIKRKIDNT